MLVGIGWALWEEVENVDGIINHLALIAQVIENGGVVAQNQIDFLNELLQKFSENEILLDPHQLQFIQGLLGGQIENYAFHEELNRIGTCQ